MDWHLILPAETGWGRADLGSRPGDSAAARAARQLSGAEGHGLGERTPSPRRKFSAPPRPFRVTGWRPGRRSCGRGFLALPGGHRLGVCGRLGPQGFEEISSLCVRMAHEIKGVGDALFPQVQGRNLLICGAPGAGKTTLLRDLIRLYGLAGTQVGLADARGGGGRLPGGRAAIGCGPLLRCNHRGDSAAKRCCCSCGPWPPRCWPRTRSAARRISWRFPRPGAAARCCWPRCTRAAWRI